LFKTWPMKKVDFGPGIRPKACDYNGWVWHVWWSTRKSVVPGVVGSEVESTYHAKSMERLNEIISGKKKQFKPVSVMPTMDGRPVVCRCGCRIYTEFQESKYRCNSCGLEYEVEKKE